MEDDKNTVEEPVVTRVSSETGDAGSRARPKRSIASRIFILRPYGYVKLLVTCLLVGYVAVVIGYDDVSRQSNSFQLIIGFLSDIVPATIAMISRIWQPLVVGLGIVVPLWLFWRVISLPFRK